jgi:hypothetical protein
VELRTWDHWRSRGKERRKLVTTVSMRRNSRLFGDRRRATVSDRGRRKWKRRQWSERGNARLSQILVFLQRVTTADRFGCRLYEAADSTKEDEGLDVELVYADEMRRVGEEEGGIVDTEGRVARRIVLYEVVSGLRARTTEKWEFGEGARGRKKGDARKNAPIRLPLPAPATSSSHPSRV